MIVYVMSLAEVQVFKVQRSNEILQLYVYTPIPVIHLTTSTMSYFLK